MPLYFGVNGQAQKVDKMYVGVGDNQARGVAKAYVGVDGQARLFYNKASPPQANDAWAGVFAGLGYQEVDFNPVNNLWMYPYVPAYVPLYMDENGLYVTQDITHVGLWLNENPFIDDSIVGPFLSARLPVQNWDAIPQINSFEDSIAAVGEGLVWHLNEQRPVADLLLVYDGGGGFSLVAAFYDDEDLVYLNGWYCEIKQGQLKWGKEESE